MPYKIDLMNEKGVVKLKFSGESDSDDHKRSREDAVNFCEENKFVKVLVDMTEQESFMSGDTVKLYDYGKEFAKGLFPTGTKLAVVNENGPKPDVNFVVTVSRNRGVFMQLYNDTSEALEWLLS